jgi:hypothetical protein
MPRKMLRRHRRDNDGADEIAETYCFYKTRTLPPSHAIFIAAALSGTHVLIRS